MDSVTDDMPHLKKKKYVRCFEKILIKIMMGFQIICLGAWKSAHFWDFFFWILNVCLLLHLYYIYLPIYHLSSYLPIIYYLSIHHLSVCLSIICLSIYYDFSIHPSIHPSILHSFIEAQSSVGPSSSKLTDDDLEDGLPASTSLVLELQVCITTPGSCSTVDKTQGLEHVRQAFY